MPPIIKALGEVAKIAKKIPTGKKAEIQKSLVSFLFGPEGAKTSPEVRANVADTLRVLAKMPEKPLKSIKEVNFHKTPLPKTYISPAGVHSWRDSPTGVPYSAIDVSLAKIPSHFTPAGTFEHEVGHAAYWQQVKLYLDRRLGRTSTYDEQVKAHRALSRLAQEDYAQRMGRALTKGATEPLQVVEQRGTPRKGRPGSYLVEWSSPQYIDEQARNSFRDLRHYLKVLVDLGVVKP